MKWNQFVSAAVGVLLAGGIAWGFRDTLSSGTGMARAAQNYLATLDAAQRTKSNLKYDLPERTDWHFIPKPTRKGLQIREMNAAQRTAAQALLRTTLSEVGYGKATKIMELEKILLELEKNRTGSPLRDPERYFFTVFGEPNTTGKWGLSIEGHHLSLNFVVDNGKVIACSPTALATNPAIVKSEVAGAAPVGTRLLAKEEQLAFDLLGTLDDAQRKVAVIAAEPLKEVRAAGEPQPPQDAPAGIAAAKLNESQRATLQGLIATYAHNLADDVAQAKLDEISQAGLEKVHFAWAGADKPGVGHYYRIQGPTFLIEFVNVQPDAAGNPANHVHCVWRDPRGDFAITVAK